jgi:zinc protease
MNFFKTYYAPDNAVIAIAGDVDADKLLPIIKEKYGSIKRSEHLTKLKKERDDEKNYISKAKLGVDYEYYSTNPLPKFMVAYPGEKLGTRRAFVMDVLAYMLGNGGSSLLTQKYVKNAKPTLSEISLSNYNLVHSGVFYFSGELMEGVDFNQFKTQFKEDIKSFCKEGIDSRTLQKTKNQIMSTAYQQMKTNAGLASMIMLNEKLYGDYNYGVKELEIYNSVTEGEVKKECDGILNKISPIVITTWNKFPKPKIAENK